jgi:hypothetical protein
MSYEESLRNARDSLSSVCLARLQQPYPDTNTLYTLSGLHGVASLEISSFIKIVGDAEIESLSITGSGEVLLRNLILFSLDIDIDGKVTLENCKVLDGCRLKARSVLSGCSFKTIVNEGTLDALNCRMCSLSGGKNKLVGCWVESDAALFQNAIVDGIQSYLYAPVLSEESRVSLTRCVLDVDDSPSENISDCTVRFSHSVSERRRHTLTNEKVYVLENVFNVVQDIYLPGCAGAGDVIHFVNSTTSSILVIHGILGEKKHRLAAGAICSAIYTGVGWVIKV